jgi:uroporphyrinogen-III synthase
VAAGETVIVTRPGAAGRALVDELQRLGQPALWLPAFEFGAAPDEARARAVLAQLSGFDLAIFVSPQSARATAALLEGGWPRATTIAAVGTGTCKALLDIPGARQAHLIAPAGDDGLGGSGSEALWPRLQALRPFPRRVLLLRAQSGREWLGQRLVEASAEVTTLAVYSRLPPSLPDRLRQRLSELAADRGMASIISSSDAVDSVGELFAAQPQVLAALRAGAALASHPRIAARLRDAGFRHVQVCAPEAGAIVAALRGAGG